MIHLKKLNLLNHKGLKRINDFGDNRGGGEKSGYLEISGGAYINLAGIPGIYNSDSFSCTFQIPNLDTAGRNDIGYIFGYQSSSSYGFFIYGSGWPPAGFLGRFGSNFVSLSLTPINAKHTYERSGMIYLSSSNTIWLFGNNYDGGKYSNITIRFWGFSVTRSGAKVIDLVPAIENGVAGVKDLISGNFYGNSGSGTITFVEE